MSYAHTLKGEKELTKINITVDYEELKEALTGSNMADHLKALSVMVLNAYMEAERDEHIEAGRYEQTTSRRDYRNGYYTRDYTLPIGSIELKVPRTRSGDFSPSIFHSYQRMDQAFVLSMVEMVVQGVSTRKVSEVVESLCGHTVSKSFVSSAMKHLDPQVKDFQERNLKEKQYLYLYVDATYIKVLEDSRSVSKAIYIAQAVDTEGFRDLVGFKVAGNESKDNWQAFFQDLKERGFQCPRLVISDAHEGIKYAVEREFRKASWQRCTVHFLRNLCGSMPKKDSEDAKEALKLIFRSSSLAEAQGFKRHFELLVEGDARYNDTLRKLDEGFMDALQYTNEPKSFHVSLRTTNSLERVNNEIKRRTRVVRLFPNLKAATRLVGAVLLDMNEKFSTKSARFLSKNRPDIMEIRGFTQSGSHKG